jgi:CubicO group peptidase (beta-lactamase class C family)
VVVTDGEWRHPFREKMTVSSTTRYLGRTTLAACSALATGSLSAAHAPAPPPAYSPLPDTAALRRDIPGLLRVSGIPGLSMAVIKNGQVIWTRGFGTINDSARTRVGAGTIFEAASLSKPVFAYLVLRLADRGELDLDRPLSEMIEYARLPHDERAKRITARMVLSHATGLPNWGGARLTLSFDPGTAYGYSGEAFLYLQKALEQVTGRSLDDLAREEVFQPLGMTRSSYVWRDRFAGDAAYGKDWLWRAAPIDHYTEAEAGSAYSLLTTAGDYARFVAAVLTGRGLSPATETMFLTPGRETSPGVSMALGIRVEQGPRGRMFYHSGNNGRRFTCYMTGDLASRDGFVYFTNASNGTSLVATLASRVFGPNFPARHYATIDRYDDPRILALQSVKRAALDDGADAARRRLRTISAKPATHPTLDDLMELGEFFAGRGLGPLAIEILQQVVAAAPESVSAGLALGRAFESTGDLDRAMASYRQARTVEGDGGDAERHMRWTEERLAARHDPVTVSAEALERLTGRYQDRTITVRDGRLWYEGGPTPASWLRPLSDTVFEVETEPDTRLLFTFTGSDPAAPAKLIGLNRDGTLDVWPRSPQAGDER